MPLRILRSDLDFISTITPLRLIPHRTALGCGAGKAKKKLRNNAKRWRSKRRMFRRWCAIAHETVHFHASFCLAVDKCSCIYRCNTYAHKKNDDFNITICGPFAFGRQSNMLLFRIRHSAPHIHSISAINIYDAISNRLRSVADNRIEDGRQSGCTAKGRVKWWIPLTHKMYIFIHLQFGKKVPEHVTTKKIVCGFGPHRIYYIYQFQRRTEDNAML